MSGAYPTTIPPINYQTNTIDITLNKYTYVSFASYENFTAAQNAVVSGFVTLSTNYSNNNTYFIYSSFELYPLTSSYFNSQANNVVLSSLVYNTTFARWQFEWWFVNSMNNVIGNIGTLRFVIFFYAPQLIGGTSINYSTTLQPSTVNGTPHNSNFISNNFTGGTGYNDIVNFFPVISYVSINSSPTTTGYYTGTVSIVNYNTTSYVVLNTMETQNGLTPPFDTRKISAITIDNKKINSFHYSYYTTTSASLKIIFIIIYY